MLKSKIIKIDNTNYTLKINNKTYNINIIFYGEKKPQINDIIYIPNKLLKEINIYSYGPLNGKYSINNNTKEEEFIKVIASNEEYYLQRYYG